MANPVPLNTFETEEDRLAFDIAYALAKSKFKVKRGQGIEACQPIANDIVEHLKLANWEFSIGPEAPAH